ncbi:metalloprotease [Azospirillaceae bacterium]
MKTTLSIFLFYISKDASLSKKFRRRKYENRITMRLTPMLCVFILSGCIGNVATNYSSLLDVGQSAFELATLDDEKIIAFSKEMIQKSDDSNKIAPPESSYSKRLNRLTSSYRSVNGQPLKFKVYITPELNAFASSDGSVRVYSGLMDKMTDDELKYVIGHEIGHVAKGHVREKMQVYHTAHAGRAGLSMVNGAVGQIAGSQLGSFMEEVINAQFSQSEEQEANDYGFDIAIAANASPKAPSSALRKLGGDNKGGFMNKILSSHPDPESRAQRLEERRRK